MSSWPDWASVFPDDGAPLPLAQDPDFLWAVPTVARGGFVRLSDLAEAAPQRQQPGAPMAVFADVLRVEGALTFAVEGLTLQARRIEVGAGASLNLRAPDPAVPDCQLALRADEWAWAGSARHLALTVADFLHPFEPRLAGGGLDVAMAADGSITLREAASPVAGDPLAAQMALNVARRLANTAPAQVAGAADLPRRMAAWVARTASDPLLRTDAEALVAALASGRARRPFVPNLKLDAYRTLADTTLTALTAVEDQRARLFNRQLSLEDQRDAGKHLLQHYRNARRYANRLLDQAATEMAQAQDTLTRAQTLLEERSGAVKTAQSQFEDGLEAQRQALERQVIWTVLGGLALVAVGVATVWATGPAGAATAASGAAAAAGAGAKAAEQVSRLARLLQMIGRVVEAIQKIKTYYEGLKAVYDAINDPLAARARAEAAAQHLPPPLDPDDDMGDAEWQEFDAALEGAFQPALDEGIDGTPELLLAMRRLAIRGRDLVAIRQVLHRCQQTLQQRLWQRLRDEADISDMQARLARIREEAGPGQVLMAYHGQLRDRLRFRLVDAIEDLSAAYRYETLTEPGARPDASASPAELAAGLADLWQQLVNAKARRGGLGTWRSEALVQQAPGPLASLRSGGGLSWVIEQANFPGLDRIRVQEIRVWLQGGGTAGPLHVVIETPGEYVDRLGSRVYPFTSWPLQRHFLYTRRPDGEARDAWGEPVHITFRDNDAEGDFFEPTAFSTWTVSLPKSVNPGLDPATITAVALEFRGTAQGSRALRSARRGAVRGRARGAPAATVLTHVVVL